MTQPIIQLTRGKSAVVDSVDYPEISRFKWHALKRPGDKWHAARTDHSTGSKRTLYMHRVIVGALPGEEVDHENGDGLDNRRSNIRRCTKRQNALNRRSGDKSKSSRFHGVTWYPHRNRWRVVICAGPPNALGNAKQLHVGLFRDETEAARAYDRAAIKHFGAFATTNFPREEYA